MASNTLRGSLRPGQSGPHSYVFLVLLLMVVVLAFNFWNSSTKNASLLEQLSKNQNLHKVCTEELINQQKQVKERDTNVEKTKQEMENLMLGYSKLKMSENGYLEKIESCGRNISDFVRERRNLENSLDKAKQDCEMNMEASETKLKDQCAKDMDDLKKDLDKRAEEHAEDIQKQQQREEELLKIIQRLEIQLKKLKQEQQLMQQWKQKEEQGSKKLLRGLQKQQIQSNQQQSQNQSNQLGNQQQTERQQTQLDIQQQTQSQPNQEVWEQITQNQSKQQWNQQKTQAPLEQSQQATPVRSGTEVNYNHTQKQEQGQTQEKQEQGQAQEKQEQVQGQLRQEQKQSLQEQEQSQLNQVQVQDWQKEEQGHGQQRQEQRQGQQKQEQDEGHDRQKRQQGQYEQNQEQQKQDNSQEQETQGVAKSEKEKTKQELGQEEGKEKQIHQQDDGQSRRNQGLNQVKDGLEGREKLEFRVKEDAVDSKISNSTTELQSNSQNTDEGHKVQPPEPTGPAYLKFGTDHAPGLRPGHWFERARRPGEPQELQHGSTGIQSAKAFAGKTKSVNDVTKSTGIVEGHKGVSTIVEDASEQEKLVGKPGMQEVAGSPGQLGGIVHSNDEKSETLEVEPEQEDLLRKD